MTPEQREAKLRQIADNDIRLLQAQAELEQQQVELFGIVLPPQQIEREVQDAASAWLTPSALFNMIQQYLTNACGGTSYITGDSALKTLRLGQEPRQRILEDFQKLARRTSPLYRGWEQWLRGTEQRLEITFDDACASEKREAAFITPIHPFAVQAASALGFASPVYTAFRVRNSNFPPGKYPFAIYQWRKRGIRDDALLQPICADSALTEQFFELLQNAEPATDSTEGLPEQSVFDALEASHYHLWSQARSEHLEMTAQIARFRREGLRVSHNARIAGLNERLGLISEVRDSPDAKFTNQQRTGRL